MRYLCAILLLLQLSLPASAQRAGLTFRSHGNEVQSHSAQTLDFLVAHQKVDVISPKSHVKITLRGFPLAALLNAVYGRQLEPGESLLVKSKDGYRVLIPESVISKHEGFLAFSLGDKSPLPARLAPFYLVWKDIPDSNTHRKMGRFWPRQIVSIELTGPVATEKL